MGARFVVGHLREKGGQHRGDSEATGHSVSMLAACRQGPGTAFEELGTEVIPKV